MLLNHEDTISLLCHNGTSLAHVQLGVHQDPWIFFCQGASQPVGPQPVPGVVPPHVQDFALAFAELHVVPVRPFPQPVKVPQDGSTILWCISHSSQFAVISKLAEGTLCSIIQIINEDVEQDWMQYRPLGYTASYWPSARLQATDHHPLGPVIQTVSNPPRCLLSQPIHQQLLCGDLMGNSVKILTEVEVGNIHCSPLIQQASHLILKVYQVGQT
ncbi:hypothetical protein QYF61_021082 [Mycteria americana]|uniref:Uncharacterized protein n=1 Tax=Mycteria americana TaxID=33587 RepID=A0AAN7P0Y6_MYCAM|nr:hypothetical protein QYF61_021082 [Mycteria americana]